MEVIKKIVDTLEHNPSTEQSIFIYRLRNAQAANLQSVLNVLFGSGSSTGLGGNTGRSSANRSAKAVAILCFVRRPSLPKSLLAARRLNTRVRIPRRLALCRTSSRT